MGHRMHEISTPRPAPLTASTAPLIGVLLIVDSLHFVFARLLLPLLPPLTAALFVLAIGTAEVGLFGMLRRRIDLATFVRRRWFFLSIGFCVAASTALNYTAVAFIDPGTASLLAKAQIAFTLSIGIIWLRDRLTRTQGAGTLLALFGVAIISFQPGDYLSPGALMVLASAFLYALHAAITKRYGGQIDFVDFFFFRLLCTTAFLLLFVVSRQALVWPGANAWWVLLVGTIDVVVSRTIYYVLLRRLSVSLLSIVLTLSPVATIGWSLLLFSTWPTPRQLLGGAAVLLGVGIVTIARSASGAE
jgi:O-acetylserine/cysteine efflux transporter